MVEEWIKQQTMVEMLIYGLMMSVVESFFLLNVVADLKMQLLLLLLLVLLLLLYHQYTPT